MLPDLALQSAVANALGFSPEHALTVDELSGLTVLEVRDAGIMSLEGLQYAINLRELDLRGNSVQDLTPLKGLVALESLNLRENPGIEDLSPLAGLSNLRYLNINLNHRVVSIRPLAGLSRLEVLLMRGVRVLHLPEEQEVLRRLWAVQRLNLRDTGLSTVTVLQGPLEAGAYREQLDLQENPLLDQGLLLLYGAEITDFSDGSPRFSGRVRLSSGVFYGWEEWSGSDAAGERELSELHTAGFLYGMDMRFRLEYKPSARTRLFLSVENELDEDDVQFGGFSLEQAYIDLSPKDRVLFRFGKQEIEWGIGKLIENPGNLLADSEDGFSLRGDATLPWGHVNAVVDSRSAYFRDGEAPGFREIAYAARYQVPLGPVALGSSLWYRDEAMLPVRSAGFAVLRLRDTAFAAEAVAHFHPDEPSTGNGWIIANATLFAGRPAWRFITEYLYDSSFLDYQGHFAGLALRSPRQGAWRSELSWRHLFADDSGEIELSIERILNQNVSLEFALPLVYGSYDSYYRTESSVPGGTVAAALMRVNLEIRF